MNFENDSHSPRILALTHEILLVVLGKIEGIKTRISNT